MLDLDLQKYVDWDIGSIMYLKERDNYAYRVTLIYRDGKKKVQQKSGFRTKKDAETAKNQTIAELVNRTYAVNNTVTVEELLDYWLENEIRRTAQSSNTYDTFKNIAVGHIVPFLGKKKVEEVNKGDVQRLYKNEDKYSDSTLRLVKTVLSRSLNYAKENGIISHNVADGVRLPRKMESTPYHTRNIDSSKTLTMEQMKLLIEKAKDSPIYIQVLLNALCGLRRQEINAVKYSDIDYINRVLYIERQLGKGLRRDNDDNDNLEHTTKNVLPLKTSSSKRTIPIPDILMEAIFDERKKYERRRSRHRSQFKDLDYICCGAYGSPRSKDYHYKYWKQLLKDCGLPNIRWHDLRSSYCTLLIGNSNNFSPKAVSKLMGHSKELITVDVYADAANVIPAEIPELEAYINEVLEKDQAADTLAQNTVIDVNGYFDSEE